MTTLLFIATAYKFTKTIYSGEVYVHQPRHTRIVQVAVDPVSVQDNIIYFSSDIDEQFYIHSHTGYVMVNTLELITGNYTFTVTATTSGEEGSASAIINTTVVVGVVPEFHFIGTEQDGDYVGYVPNDAPVGMQVLSIMPQFTLLTDTRFNCSTDEDTSFSVNSVGVVMLANVPNMSGLEQFTVKCLAITPSSDVIETLTVNVTVVIYLISGNSNMF